LPPSPKESFGLLPGRPICYSLVFVVFKGVHAFAAEGRLRFEGQKKQKPFSIPRCLGHKSTTHQKKAIAAFGV